ncbi:MAG TPA: 6,7-dimethyl-8-ribityllumazine synthase [Hyphomicrobiales bacterium]|nr:6,7-dimethyl-8-ribityllumazine synthase [Rhodobiaceae bacterium]HXK53329.1 6,7-dimethyl-8-ribityllumazine synthase [Hyphomicrobiales bacterium]
MTRKAPKLLIIEARFYGDLADELVRGAIRAIEEAGATFERVSVPGVLEIPAALAYAVESGGHDGYVLLGCVIRGETSHYDIVAVESARAAMDLAVRHRLALGNGILTVENGDQAWARARVEEKNKGAAAAQAALAMVKLRAQMEPSR